MPNSNPPFQNLSLDPAEVVAVNEAYDPACQTLQNIGQLEVDARSLPEAFCGPRKPASGTPTGCASVLSMD
jgi:hypothetical protein